MMLGSLFATVDLELPMVWFLGLVMMDMFGGLIFIRAVLLGCQDEDEEWMNEHMLDMPLRAEGEEPEEEQETLRDRRIIEHLHTLQPGPRLE